MVQVLAHAAGAKGGYVFVAEKKGGTTGGPMIVDSRGRVVWYHQIAPPQQATDFRVQRYHGKPVLTWWQGIESVAGTGRGEYEIYDTSYGHIATVRAGNGLHGDLHEFQLTPRGTAFITAYREVAADLSGVGGPKRGFVDDSVVEEIDIATGRVLFEWHSIDHIPLSESTPGAPRAGPQRQPEAPARLLPRQFGRRRSRRHSADLGAGTCRRSTCSPATGTSSGGSAASRATSGRRPPSPSPSSTTRVSTATC